MVTFPIENDECFVVVVDKLGAQPKDSRSFVIVFDFGKAVSPVEDVIPKCICSKYVGGETRVVEQRPKLRRLSYPGKIIRIIRVRKRIDSVSPSLRAIAGIQRVSKKDSNGMRACLRYDVTSPCKLVRATRPARIVDFPEVCSEPMRSLGRSGRDSLANHCGRDHENKQ